MACLLACGSLASVADAVAGPGEAGFAFAPKSCKIPERFRNHPLFTRPVVGMNFGYGGRRGYYAAHLDEPGKMKAMGVNWCVLKIHPMMETFCSRKVFFDPVFTVGEQETADMIRKLHECGIHVMLQPCVMSLDSTPMACSLGFPDEKTCQIEGRHPQYWQPWFESFREVLNVLAAFAERTGVEAMIIGCEYNQTIHRDREWRETVRQVRERYSGPVSYENGGTDAYPWLDALDFVCLSYYPGAAPLPPEDFRSAEQWSALPDVPRKDMVAWLKKNAVTALDNLQKASGGLPVVITEAGMTSTHGWCRRPWDGMWPVEKGVKEGYQEQADYIDAFFEVFAARPYCGGVCIWKWDESQPRWFRNDDPMKDQGFMIQGKPAGKVFRKWAAKASPR